jgi:peptidoglycan/xylan/chitin deacetylase (PgdA/CDA1 family)/glycosyltransferase involved in cell wall biosynthesis
MFKLSVIVPTLNRKKVLERTLPALEAQDLPPDEFEVIVIDNGSSDGTLQFLEAWKPPFASRILQVSRRGVSAARNAGVLAASGTLILFLDDDLIASPTLFSRHCAAHQAVTQQQIVRGHVTVAPGSSKTIIRGLTESYYEHLNQLLTSELELRFPDDVGPSISLLSSMVNCSMPREALLRCGGFDEAIFAAEDLELGIRLWKMGLPLRCDPAAVAEEFYTKASHDYLFQQAVSSGKGDWRVVHKHPEYRPYSSLAAFSETTIAKRWLRNMAMRFPLSPVPLMAISLRLERFFFNSVPLRKIGERIFQAAERIQRLRSGLKAAGSWERLESEYDRRLPVLMYHRVGPLRPGMSREWNISPEEFERHIHWIKQAGYETVLPAEWLSWLQTGTRLPRKPVLITFDDAYADTAKFGLPILQSYGMKAAVYVVTQRIAGTNTWDEIKGSEALQLMTADQIRYWAGQGVEFGAHSRAHSDLTALSPEEVNLEVQGSRDDLEAIIGGPVTSFAYPFGKQTDAVRDVVKQSFDLAFCSEEGLNYLRCDRHLLKRSYIGANTSTAELRILLRSGSIQKIRAWKSRIALRTRLRRAFRIFSPSK